MHPSLCICVQRTTFYLRECTVCLFAVVFFVDAQARKRMWFCGRQQTELLDLAGKSNHFFYSRKKKTKKNAKKIANKRKKINCRFHQWPLQFLVCMNTCFIPGCYGLSTYICRNSNFSYEIMIRKKTTHSSREEFKNVNCYNNKFLALDVPIMNMYKRTHV